MANTAILFSPAAVARVLANLPTLASLLPDPQYEGEPSEAFPGVLRKTDRKVYGWIANTHYRHLAEAVPYLERPHAAGCRFGNLLTTRNREQFISHMAEALVAEELLHRGYAVRTIERTTQGSPDLHVAGDGIDMAIEVYSPRELTAIDEWVQDVTSLLQYVDVRATFRSRVDTKIEPTIPPQRGKPLNPWAPAEILTQTRRQVIAEITHDVEAALHELKPLAKTYRHGATSMLTTVELEEVQPASDAGPVRQGTFSYPGFSGYSPAGVFGTTVTKALRKAGKRQAEGVPAAARALVVYVMGTKIAEDLGQLAHAGGAEAWLDEIEPEDYGLDAIAFVVRTLPRGVGAVFTVVDDRTLTLSQVRAMFDALP